MKKINSTLVLLIFVFVCRGQEKQDITFDAAEIGVAYIAFGEKINPENAISNTELSETYANMAVTDTVQTTFRATVTDVCKAKGCWMKLRLQDGEEAMVRFSNYGFFVPKDIEGREVVVNGQAFVEHINIEDQKHYAKDGGRSEAEIAKITEAKRIYGFTANAVLLVAE